MSMNNKQRLMVGLLTAMVLMLSVAYAGEKKVVVTLGKKEAVANGEKVLLDVPPQLVNGTLMVPFRFIGKSLGANIEWNKKSGTATLAMETPTIEMYTEENEESFKKLKELIEDKNTKRIWIEMYELTDGIYKGDFQDTPSIQKSLLEKAKTGAEIKIILDYKQHHNYKDYNPSDDFDADDRKVMIEFEKNFEDNNNCEIKWWNGDYYLHRKICIFGNKTTFDRIWIGSSNFTYPGLHRNKYDKSGIYNKEINMKIIDADLVKQFESLFNEDWCEPNKDECQLVENLEEPCPKKP